MNAQHIDHRYKVGVLMGGKSIEREVSFNSGRTICDHLDTTKYEVIPLFQTEVGDVYVLPWHFLHRGKITDFRDRLDSEAKKVPWDQLKDVVDFVYISVHGRYAEDGTLQGMFEVMGIPYLGAKVFGSALGMNKSFHKSVLKSNGIDVPAGIIVRPAELENLDNKKLQERLKKENVSFPCIVKPSKEGSSFGVSVVDSVEQLLDAIKEAAYVDGRLVQDVIVEEKVEGMEFVCVSLQKQHGTDGSDNWFSFPITEVVIEKNSGFFDYEQKYMPGRALKVTPARCSDDDQEKIKRVCEHVARVLNLATISRVDGILTKDGRVVIIDPNSLTGMGPTTFLFHQAAEFGMSHTQLINFLIESELAQYGITSVSSKNYDAQEGLNMKQEKIRVAVLLGGDTNEREISLESGRNVCYKLSPEKYDVTPLFVRDDMKLFKLSQKLLIKNSTRAIAGLVSDEFNVAWADLPQQFDFVFVGLHGGKGEGGAVQGALEMLGVPYNGSGVLTSALCMDKYKTNQFLKTKGFDVPTSVLVHKFEWEQKSEEEKQVYADTLAETIGAYPFIVKPHDDGCSMFVKKVSDYKQLCDTFEEIFASGKDTAMCEEIIVGMELTCGVYGNDQITVLPPSQAVAIEGILSIEEKFLPGAGTNITPAPLPADALTLVQDVIGQAYKALGCVGYTRIDCFYQDAQQSSTGQERVVFLENNSLPGLTPATCLFHQAAEVGIRPMEMIDLIVQLGLQRHRKTLSTSKSISEQDVVTHLKKTSVSI